MMVTRLGTGTMAVGIASGGVAYYRSDIIWVTHFVSKVVSILIGFPFPVDYMRLSTQQCPFPSVSRIEMSSLYYWRQLL